MADGPNLSKLAMHCSDEKAARTLLEEMRWGKNAANAACPHCGNMNPYRLTPKTGSTTRQGLWKCRENACRKQFTVTVRTVFEDSHVPISKWLLAIQLLCASKKGMSAHQLHRMLGVTYKTAWFMAHRLRYVMADEPSASKALTALLKTSPPPKGKVPKGGVPTGGAPKDRAPKRGKPGGNVPAKKRALRSEEGRNGRTRGRVTR